MNIFNRLHGLLLPWLAKHRSIGGVFMLLNPVFTDVIRHAETPWGIEPLYTYKIFGSPKVYIQQVRETSLPAIVKPLVIVVGILFGWLLALYYHQMGNVRDVRWRKSSVRDLLIRAIESFISRGERRINVGIYGSGSARYALTAWKKSHEKGRKVRMYLIDKDPETFKLASRVAAEIGITEEQFNDNFRFVQEDVLSIPDAYFKVHGDLDIVTFVGIGDHFDKRYSLRKNADSVLEADILKTNPTLIQAYEKILSQLNTDGIFITSFVNHNREESFMTRVANWKHRYRSAEGLTKTLQLAGWSSQDAEIFSGPCKIQNTVYISGGRAR